MQLASWTINDKGFVLTTSEQDEVKFVTADGEAICDEITAKAKAMAAQIKAAKKAEKAAKRKRKSKAAAEKQQEQETEEAQSEEPAAPAEEEALEIITTTRQGTAALRHLLTYPTTAHTVPTTQHSQCH